MKEAARPEPDSQNVLAAPHAAAARIHIDDMALAVAGAAEGERAAAALYGGHIAVAVIAHNGSRAGAREPSPRPIARPIPAIAWPVNVIRADAIAVMRKAEEKPESDIMGLGCCRQAEGECGRYGRCYNKTFHC